MSLSVQCYFYDKSVLPTVHSESYSLCIALRLQHCLIMLYFRAAIMPVIIATLELGPAGIMQDRTKPSSATNVVYTSRTMGS